MKRRTERYVLAADVGGTKTALVLARPRHAWPAIVAEQVYPSQDYETFESVIAEFLARPETRDCDGRIASACACIAGPVEGDRATTTNLRWTIEARALSARFGIPAVRLVNDFAAVAFGIGRLAARDFEPLQPGEANEHGARAVMGAGTGLGVALMSWNGREYAVHPSEGGHADFAPVDALQDGLLEYLRGEYGRVSYERVLSGTGLAQIFDYLATREEPSAAMRDAVRSASDAAAAVSEFGLEGRDPVAARALDVFAAVYGAYAGNVALTVLARGGVYIAGGIAPKIAGKLKDGTFVRAFTSKGRFSALLETIPVSIVMNPKVGLYGALDLARRLLQPAATSQRQSDRDR